MRRTLKLLTAALLFPLAAAPIQAQDWAKARLDASPRHHEYVNLKHGDRTVQAFVVYPEVKTNAPVIILIHEIFGLSDWAKLMADRKTRGRPLSALDTIMAAIANANSCIVVTANEKDFEGVEIVNPLKPGA